MLDILALHLSPRKYGNSDVMLDEFIRGASQSGAQVEKFSVAEHNIKHCLGCVACEKTGKCIITDDDMQQLYPLLGTVPKVVVSTSLFFYDVPGLGKNLIDRTQPIWSQYYTLGRSETRRPEGQGFLLAVGATKGKDLFMPVNLSMKYFFDSIGLPKTFGSLCLREVENLGDLVKMPEYMEQIYQAGLAFGLKNRDS